MVTQIILWGGVFLECLLLFRGFRGKLLACFPLFYSYLLFDLVETLSLSGLSRSNTPLYAWAYWNCDFVALVLGSLVLFEIYQIALRPFPGTARVARILLFFVFALTFAKVLVNYSYGSLSWPARTAAELERNLRVVQAFGVLAIVCVMLLYSIPRSRHLKGILAGYGLFVASRVIQLSLLSYLGDSFQRLLVYLMPFSFLIALYIWTVALWSPVAESAYSPSPLEIAAVDHPALVSRTQQDLQNLQLGLPGAARR